MSGLNSIDDMPNITGNFSDDVFEHDETPYERIFLEVFTTVGLLSVIANSLIIFVILKYNKMKQDPTNVIFLHINILQAVYLFAAPLTLRVGMAFFDVSPVHMAVFCVSYQIESTVMFAITWFLFLFICDWYLKLYFKDTYVKFCRVYKFFLITLYVLTILVSSISIELCFRSYIFIITYLILIICVVLIMIFLIVINIIHAVRKRRVIVNQRKGYIGLAIANICFLLWTPAFIFLLISVKFHIHAPVFIIIFFSLGFSSPIFNLIYLYLFDDNYNVFLKQVFRCKCNEYRNESLEDHSVSYNDVNGVKITENSC